MVKVKHGPGYYLEIILKEACYWVTALIIFGYFFN